MGVWCDIITKLLIEKPYSKEDVRISNLTEILLKSCCPWRKFSPILLLLLLLFGARNIFLNISYNMFYWPLLLMLSSSRTLCRLINNNWINLNWIELLHLEPFLLIKFKLLIIDRVYYYYYYCYHFLNYISDLYYYYFYVMIITNLTETLLLIIITFLFRNPNILFAIIVTYLLFFLFSACFFLVIYPWLCAVCVHYIVT
jgi:hypothetical protein